MPTFYFPVSDFCIGAFCPFMELFLFYYDFFIQDNSEPWTVAVCFFQLWAKFLYNCKTYMKQEKEWKAHLKLTCRTKCPWTHDILNVHQMFKRSTQCLHNVLFSLNLHYPYISPRWYQELPVLQEKHPNNVFYNNILSLFS